MSSLVSQNSDRWNILNAEYDPVAGIGSPVPRIPLFLTESLRFMVPFTMEEEEPIKYILKCGTLQRAAKNAKLTADEVLKMYVQIRCKHDFEFWAISCAEIVTKADGVQKFKLNRPQRKLLKVMESMRIALVPIRIILLKARQWGGSTFVQLYMAWIQLFHRTNWNSMIVAAKKDQALHIRGMYSRVAEAHPPGVIPGIDRLKMSPYMLTQNMRIIEGRDSIIGVGSVEEPDSIRSFTTQMLHLSEIGLWKDTPSVSAQQMIATLEGGLVTKPYTIVVKESTAKGIGNYFYNQWNDSVAGKTNDRPVFVSWFEMQGDYVQDVPNQREFAEKYLNGDTANEYWRYLWSLGATFEHIAWYMTKRKNIDDWDMKTEFPSTPEEAFQSTGHRFFPLGYVEKARATCLPPIAVGDLHAAARKGKDTFKKIEFTPSPGGYLSIWTFPGKLGLEVPGKRYSNRYCAFGDVGGASKGADYSSITILDRFMTMAGGAPYVCAEWHGHLDHDLFAWYGARLCYWYDKALYAVETNSLHNDHGDETRGFEADHSLTVLDEIKDYYPNMYYRIKPETIQEKWTGVLGFLTNKTTKVMILDAMKGALREQTYEERNKEACDEMDWYEEKPDGSLGAIKGQHDDRVITRAGCNWLSEQMGPVVEVDIVEDSRVGTSKPGSFGRF